MLVLTLVAPVFAANCYVVARGPGRECLVIDPGAGAAPAVREAVAQHGLTPVALLATHGHADHTWDAAELSDTYAAPLYIHALDAYRLADPFGTLGLGGAGAAHGDGRTSPLQVAAGPLAEALRGAGRPPEGYLAPSSVVGVDTGVRGSAALELADLPVTVLHAPGHTQGAALLSVPFGPGEGSKLLLGDSWPEDVSQNSRTVFSGDVLFAGTIGRTDLPGGDAAQMQRTLADPVGMLAPEVLVLPGHGPGTRMDVEYRRNPFLTAPDVL